MVSREDFSKGLAVTLLLSKNVDVFDGVTQFSSHPAVIELYDDHFVLARYVVPPFRWWRCRRWFHLVSRDYLPTRSWRPGLSYPSGCRWCQRVIVPICPVVRLMGSPKGSYNVMGPGTPAALAVTVTSP